MHRARWNARWNALDDAYGPAISVAPLLDHLHAWVRQADRSPELPRDLAQGLWSRLCHQNTVYTASYAALPHLVDAIAQCGAVVPTDLLNLVVCIDQSRRDGRNGPPVPQELGQPYVEALARLPALMAPVLLHAPDEEQARAALAACATAAGHARLAQVLLDLDPERLDKVLAGLWV